MTKQIEFDYYIAPDGYTHNFHNGVDKFLLSAAGQGMPPIRYITQQGPNQHGETVIDYRLQPRFLQYVIAMEGDDRYDYWDNRSSLLNALRPNRQAVGQCLPGVLRKVLPGSTTHNKRDIKVFISQGPEFSARDTENYHEFSLDETIRFYAPDPTFYDPDQVCLEWSLTESDELVFPITFPIWFGTDIINSVLSVTYTGSWMVYPSIQVVGPLQGIIIDNLTTNEQLSLGYNISLGETVTIDLAYGNKVAMNNFGIDLISTVDGDLATFHIAESPTAPGGVNQLQVRGVGALAGTTRVLISYYTRYIGI